MTQSTNEWQQSIGGLAMVMRLSMLVDSRPTNAILNCLVTLEQSGTGAVQLPHLRDLQKVRLGALRVASAAAQHVQLAEAHMREDTAAASGAEVEAARPCDAPAKSDAWFVHIVTQAQPQQNKADTMGGEWRRTCPGSAHI